MTFINSLWQKANSPPKTYHYSIHHKNNFILLKEKAVLLFAVWRLFEGKEEETEPGMFDLHLTRGRKSSESWVQEAGKLPNGKSPAAEEQSGCGEARR